MDVLYPTRHAADCDDNQKEMIRFAQACLSDLKNKRSIHIGRKVRVKAFATCKLSLLVIKES